MKRRAKVTAIQVKKKEKALVAIVDDEANGSERQVRKLMMMREREREKGNCTFTFL